MCLLCVVVKVSVNGELLLSICVLCSGEILVGFSCVYRFSCFRIVWDVWVSVILWLLNVVLVSVVCGCCLISVIVRLVLVSEWVRYSLIGFVFIIMIFIGCVCCFIMI